MQSKFYLWKVTITLNYLLFSYQMRQVASLYFDHLYDFSNLFSCQ